MRLHYFFFCFIQLQHGRAKNERKKQCKHQLIYLSLSEIFSQIRQFFLVKEIKLQIRSLKIPNLKRIPARNYTLTFLESHQSTQRYSYSLLA